MVSSTSQSLVVVLLVIGRWLAVQFTKDCEFVSHVSDIFELHVLDRSRRQSVKVSSALIALASIMLSRSVLGMRSKKAVQAHIHSC